MTKKEINTELTIFEEREVRRMRKDDKWHFVISDVVQILTDSKDVQGYIKDMRHRDEELSTGWGKIATPFISTPKEVHKR